MKRVRNKSYMVHLHQGSPSFAYTSNMTHRNYVALSGVLVCSLWKHPRSSQGYRDINTRLTFDINMRKGSRVLRPCLFDFATLLHELRNHLHQHHIYPTKYIQIIPDDVALHLFEKMSFRIPHCTGMVFPLCAFLYDAEDRVL